MFGPKGSVPELKARAEAVGGENELDRPGGTAQPAVSNPYEVE